MKRKSLPASPIGAPSQKKDFFRKVVVSIKNELLFEYRDANIQSEMVEGTLALVLDVRVRSLGVTVAKTFTVVKVVEDSLGTLFDKVIVTRPDQDSLIFVNIHGTNWFQIINEEIELSLTDDGACALRELADMYDSIALEQGQQKHRLN